MFAIVSSSSRARNIATLRPGGVLGQSFETVISSVDGTMHARLAHRSVCHPGRRQFDRTHYLRPPTALAITKRDTMRAELAWMPISILARLDRGIVSVGLNAELLVIETYR